MRPRSTLVSFLLFSLLIPIASFAQAPPPELPPATALDAAVTPVVAVPAAAAPVSAIDTAARAAADHDWQMLAASLLCIVAWGLRRFTGAAFFHTKAGALTVSGVIGVISAVLPALEAHTFTPRVAIVAVVVAVVSLVSMSNPSAAQASTSAFAHDMSLEEAMAEIDEAKAAIDKVRGKGSVPPVAGLLFFLAPGLAHADVLPTRTGASPTLVGAMVALGVMLSIMIIGAWFVRTLMRRAERRRIALYGPTLFVLLACGAASAAPGFGIVLRPGPAELAQNAAGVGDVRPFNPCELGPARWFDPDCARRVLAQADEMPVSPDAPAAKPADPVSNKPDSASVPDAANRVLNTPAPAAEKPLAQATDPRRAISNGATSQTATDCAKCIGGGVALYKQKGGPLAIAGMVLGAVLNLSAQIGVPLLVAAQSKPEADPTMMGTTP